MWTLLAFVSLAAANTYSFEDLERALERGMSSGAIEAMALQLEAPLSDEQVARLLRLGIPHDILRQATGGAHPTDEELAALRASQPAAAHSGPRVERVLPGTLPERLDIEMTGRDTFLIRGQAAGWTEVAPILEESPEAAVFVERAGTASTVATVGLVTAATTLAAGLLLGTSTGCGAPGVVPILCSYNNARNGLIVDLAAVTVGLTVALPAHLSAKRLRRQAVEAYQGGRETATP